jgi:hypothetical protein
MNQKEWYMKILNWAETDSRLNLRYMDMVVLAEHLANEERGLTKRPPDAASVCRQINHVYVDGICAECGSPEPPRR